MALVAHPYTKFQADLLKKLYAINTETLKVMLLTAYAASQDTHEFVSDVLAAGTEHTGVGGYTRQTLTTVTVSNSAHVTKLTCDNPTWTASISAAYAVFFDSSPGTDATSPVMCWWDFGGTEVDNAGNFVLAIATGGLLTLTGS